MNQALEIQLEAQRLTSHAGLVVFQRLFARLGLKESLQQCFRHLPERGAYPAHAIVLLLVVHLLLGCRAGADKAITSNWTQRSSRLSSLRLRDTPRC